MIKVKKFSSCGCTFLGKGIVGRPEMGAVVQAKTVTFNEVDCFGDWKNTETQTTMYLTDTGFAFSDEDLKSGRIEIELYASNLYRESYVNSWNGQYL